MSRAASRALQGVGAAGPDTVTSITSDAAHTREEAVDRITAIVRELLTDDVVRATQNEHGLNEIKHGVRETFSRAGRWHGKP